MGRKVVVVGVVSQSFRWSRIYFFSRSENADLAEAKAGIASRWPAKTSHSDVSNKYAHAEIYGWFLPEVRAPTHDR
jgi:hypothetical protein